MFLPGNVNVNSSDMSDSRSDRTRFALLKRRDEGETVAANSALQTTDSPTISPAVYWYCSVT
jgi:prephenate dehydratase